MLEIESSYQPVFAELGLNSFEAVTAFFAGDQRVTDGVLLRAKQLEAPECSSVSVFFKLYHHDSPSWAFFGRRSKARCEYRNYAAFAGLQIPCAERVACGELRDHWGRLRRAFIITRELPGALTLIDFVARHCPSGKLPAARKLRHALRRQVAEMTRRMHRAGFYHHDWVWRNILVTWNPPGEPKIWCIDCPRGQFDRWSPRQTRRRLKDLASLDKSAVKFCTLGERVAFMRDYLGVRRLDSTAKRLLRAVREYRRVRWPEDWPGR